MLAFFWGEWYLRRHRGRSTLHSPQVPCLQHMPIDLLHSALSFRPTVAYHQGLLPLQGPLLGSGPSRWFKPKYFSWCLLCSWKLPHSYHARCWKCRLPPRIRSWLKPTKPSVNTNLYDLMHLTNARKLIPSSSRTLSALLVLFGSTGTVTPAPKKHPAKGWGAHLCFLQVPPVSILSLLGL